MFRRTEPENGKTYVPSARWKNRIWRICRYPDARDSVSAHSRRYRQRADVAVSGALPRRPRRYSGQGCPSRPPRAARRQGEEGHLAGLNIEGRILDGEVQGVRGAPSEAHVGHVPRRRIGRNEVNTRDDSGDRARATVVQDPHGHHGGTRSHADDTIAVIEGSDRPGNVRAVAMTVMRGFPASCAVDAAP